jgi:multiple sugar transport system substrate-binding protein
MKQAGYFLDAWQKPDDPQVMSDACDKVAALIRQAIAEDN